MKRSAQGLRRMFGVGCLLACLLAAAAGARATSPVATRIVAAVAVRVAAIRLGGDPAAAAVITWLRVDPRQPRTLYLGGYYRRTDPCTYGPAQQFVCPSWAIGSTDAGAHWRSLGRALATVDTDYDGVAGACLEPPSPFRIAVDGRQLFATVAVRCSADSSQGDLLRSTDGGVHWRAMLVGTGGLYYNYYGNLALAPSAASRLYATRTERGGGMWAEHAMISSDGGGHWRDVAGDATFAAPGGNVIYVFRGGLVVDARRPDVVYAGLTHITGGIPDPSLWARSEDAGKSWAPVARPPDIPDYDGYTLGTDPHLPGLLVGQHTGDPILDDTRYLSADHGRSWRVAVCPGDLRGECPAFVLDGVFGRGRAYGFYRDGVHAFAGGGRAGPRLALSGRLPLPADALRAGLGAAQAGDPVYLMGQGASGATQLRLYCSTDAGRSWQEIHPGPSR